MIKKQLVLAYVGCLITSATSAGPNKISKLWPKTIVWAYNATGKNISSTFSVTSDGKPLMEEAYFPVDNSVNIIDQYKSGREMPMLAEFRRNRGIKNGTTYVFTETIDLPGLGPILELKQRLTGTAAGSTAEVGIAAHAANIGDLWFNDTKWHRVLLPILGPEDSNAVLEVYTVDFCFYHRALNAKGQEVTLEGIGGSPDSIKYAINKLGRPLGMTRMMIEDMKAAYNKDKKGEAFVLFSTSPIFLLSDILFSPIAVPTWLIQQMPTPYGNIVYKISHEITQAGKDKKQKAEQRAAYERQQAADAKRQQEEEKKAAEQERKRLLWEAQAPEREAALEAEREDREAAEAAVKASRAAREARSVPIRIQ